MKHILLLMLTCICTVSLSAQSTTSSISGRITENSNDPLPGATVIATHEPSGTRYCTTANPQGNFQLQGMRVGGPYRIEFSYVGYHPATFTNIQLKLAENFVQNAVMQPSTELDEVVITCRASGLGGIQTGAVTHINSTDIWNLPNINRNLTAITKLSPYANGNGFGGRDQRMNNYSIDGANFNYSMGLDGNVLPGGGNPISIDALEELQVNIAPYDVRLSNFIGASVNAITKSGTNQFKGSAYMYTKNEYLRGNKVRDYDLGDREEERRNIYGFTLGGPLVKNKLFFFVNGEYENAPHPIHKWKLSTDGNEDFPNKVSRVTAEDMSRFSKDLKEMYGYDTGSWTDFAGEQNTYRAMARIDWNVTDNHKLMFRYNYTSQQNDNNVVGGALGISGGPVSRYSMTFRNSTWKNYNNVHSLTMELNSRLGRIFNNQLLGTFTFNDGNKRECKGDFPTVDIMKPDEGGTARAFMNAGYDQHAWQNGIKEKVWSITDNLSAQIGAHSLMAGAKFESQNVSNCYMRYGAGYYRYASYDDFVNKAAPIAFALTYSLTGESRALADVHYNQFSLYLQDTYSVNPKLTLTYGLRMEIPFYVNKRYENPSITEYDFEGVKLNTANWPKATPLFSPRIGFNYDLSGNGTLKFRGGTGIFSGRFPLVFLSKMQEGSGMLQTTVSTTKKNDPLLAALAGGIRTPEQVLKEIAPQFPDRFATEPGAVNNIITIDHHFKMPQVWKSSLAIDYQLPLSFPASLTLEGIYIKDINAIVQRNLNVKTMDDSSPRLSGADNRYYYAGNVGKRVHEKIDNAMLMTNTGKGYSYNLNATLHAEPVKNLRLMAAYTYTKSKTLSNNTSNQIDGAWKQEPSVQGPNYLTLHNASYLSSPHRIIAEASYSIAYAKHLRTSVSLFYTGERAGSYTYMCDGDVNNDGYKYDLLYIPRSKEEINFQDLEISNEKTYTAEEQQEAFWNFVNQDPYLKKHKGEYAETSAAYLPWLHRFNLRVAQDFHLKVGKTTNTLQLSLDIMNIGNLLNSAWGISKGAVSAKPLQFKKLNDRNEPVYTMSTTTINDEKVLPTESFQDSRSSGNCWQLQIGIRYLFN